MMKLVWRCLSSRRQLLPWIAPGSGCRCFCASVRRRQIRDIAELPDRLNPLFKETSSHDLLALHWPSPPRNILLVRKDEDTDVTNAALQFAKHVKTTYPMTSIILEPEDARELHQSLPFPVYTTNGLGNTAYGNKVDLTATLGGDGTILHAASLFATSKSVPPVLSFSMGTLGFLGEWNFAEHTRAFREVYFSGAPSLLPSKTVTDVDISDSGAGPHVLGLTAATAVGIQSPVATGGSGGWQAALRGKSLDGAATRRSSRILLRNRLRIGIFDANGKRLPHEPPFAHPGTIDASCADIFALNEVLLHRGALPHLAHITISIGAPPHRRTLTTAIADGFLVSTPTGSTAYSLSSGGSIVHPLVASILLTPICPRSLSFRPLVLPANTTVTLRIDEVNRGKEIEVSVDGVRRRQGLKAGMEVRVVGEEVRTQGAPGARDWIGGVPSIVRSAATEDGDDDHWVGGLNSLLKFNHPFGGDEGGQRETVDALHEH